MVADEAAADVECIWTNNGGTGDVLSFNQNNFIINVHENGRKDKKLWDIYVSLKSRPEDRFLIEITKKTTYKILSELINLALEERYDHLKGLKGLRVTELKINSTKGEKSMHGHG